MGITFITLAFVGIMFWLMAILYNTSKAIKTDTKVIDYNLEKIPKGCENLENVLLNVDGEMIEVKRILVSNKGVFVIITKEYEGWIFGREEEKYWTQMVYNKKNKFLNPILENYTYVNAVKKKLADMNQVPVYSLVLFKDDCTLKKIESNIPVINCWELRRYVLNLEKDTILSKEEMKNIIESLSENAK